MRYFKVSYTWSLPYDYFGRPIIKKADQFMVNKNHPTNNEMIKAFAPDEHEYHWDECETPTVCNFEEFKNKADYEKEKYYYYNEQNRKPNLERLLVNDFKFYKSSMSGAWYFDIKPNKLIIIYPEGASMALFREIYGLRPKEIEFLGMDFKHPFKKERQHIRSDRMKYVNIAKMNISEIKKEIEGLIVYH